MRIGDIEITPLASESMGVRSFAISIITPHTKIVLDPSAALGIRSSLDPHPQEYRALESALERIYAYVSDADILTVSHYHFDHVRPGFENWHLNFSTRYERQELYQGKKLLVKDNRENINPSQRRRGFFFERDLEKCNCEITFVDGMTLEFGDTSIMFSKPLHHGPDDSRLGYVLACVISHNDYSVLFAPDVQGPCSEDTLRYLLSIDTDLLIVGGPPIYLDKFEQKYRDKALYSLCLLGSSISHVIVDHHLHRSLEWSDWLNPALAAAKKANNQMVSAAEFLGLKNNLLEARRGELYSKDPPDDDFIHWTEATREYKQKNKPPI